MKVIRRTATATTVVASDEPLKRSTLRLVNRGLIIPGGILGKVGIDRGDTVYLVLREQGVLKISKTRPSFRKGVKSLQVLATEYKLQISRADVLEFLPDQKFYTIKEVEDGLELS